MRKTFLGAFYYQKFINKILIIVRHVLKFIIVLIILFEIFNAFQWNLSIFRCRSSTLSWQSSDSFSFIDLCYAFDGESPEYFLAYHYQYFALVHFASIWNEGKRNLESGKRLNVKFCFWSVEKSENFFVIFTVIKHFDSHSDVIFEWIAELDRIGVFFHQSIEDSVVGERNRRQTHSTEFIIPISNLFRGKLDAGAFNII